VRFVPVLLSALALVACQTGDTPTPGPDFDPAVGPPLDLNLSAGHAEDEHTEVAPGVFMLTSLHQSGEVTFTPALGETLLAGESLTPDQLPGALEPTFGGGPGGGGPGPSTCYESDYRYYTDSTSAGTLFGGDTTWSASATAYSYDYPATSLNSVYAYVTTSGPSFATLDYVYAYAYVYVNERYIGYMTDYQTDDNYAYVYGSWDLPCLDGYLDLKVYTSHYVYDYPTGSYTGPRQNLSIGNTLEASVTCCP